jgi:hypothetical protein
MEIPGGDLRDPDCGCPVVCIRLPMTGIHADCMECADGSDFIGWSNKDD